MDRYECCDAYRGLAKPPSDHAAIVRQIGSRFDRVVEAFPLTSSPSLAADDEPCSPQTRGTMPSLPPQTATPRGLQDQPAATADRRQFPDHIDRNADRQPIEQRLKLAGQLAAEILKRYPHLIQQLGSTRDPVPAWAILRTVILRQWDRHPASETVTAEQIHPFTQP